MQDRLQGAARSAVSERFAARQLGPGPQRFGAGATFFAGQPSSVDATTAGWGPGALESLRESIGESLREHVVEDLRDHFESLVKNRLEDTQRERMGEAVRAAFAEQIALGGTFGADQIAETIHDRITDHLCDSVEYGLRAHLTDIVRERLAEAVRAAMSQSRVRTEASGGLH